MPNLLNQDQLKELISVAAESLGIRYPSVLEKDYYVTRIIHALSGIKNEYFCLIFSGGTCLVVKKKLLQRWLLRIW